MVPALRTLRLFAISSLLFLSFTRSASGDTGVHVGAAAPPLAVRQFLQAPPGIHGTWDELRGQAVVIEFWATWCGGCVDNIPHLNQLADEFKSQPVKFISITDETDVSFVKIFLERYPIKGWVAFDAEEATFKRYGVEGRPQTILVDGRGVIRAVTNPPSVTPAVLEDLLAGKALNFQEVSLGKPLGLEANAPTPLLQVLIRPAAPVEVSGTAPGGVNDKPGRFDTYGQTVRDILSYAYDVRPDRIDAPEWCSTVRYDLSIVTPQNDDAQRWLLARQMLEAAFALKTHKELKDTPVYVLRRLNDLSPKLRTAGNPQENGHYWSGVNGETGQAGVPSQKVAAVAEYVLKVQVFDETGLTGRYDFTLKWDPKQPSSIVSAIRDQLGLDLLPETKKLEHFVVDSIQEKKTW